MAAVWITGASSGIGEAVAYVYASAGERLVLTSSSRPALEKVAEECRRRGAAEVWVLPCDFRHPEGLEELVENAWTLSGGIDVLYCNAGISQRSTVEETSMETHRLLMEVNYFAPVALTRAILPKMLSRGGGHLAVTTSIAGVFGFPQRCGYSASKHALYGFFETLDAEYRERGIRVTVVCPGRVNTAVSLRAIAADGKPYGKMDPGQAGGLPADRAAVKIVRAIRRGRREVLVGRKELLMVYIKRFFPALCARLSRKINPV